MVVEFLSIHRHRRRQLVWVTCHNEAVNFLAEQPPRPTFRALRGFIQKDGLEFLAREQPIVAHRYGRKINAVVGAVVGEVFPHNSVGGQLVTTNIEDGVKTGYFEVELTQASACGSMYFHVGMFRPGLDHSVLRYGTGDGWVLRCSNGNLWNYSAARIPVGDPLGALKVGDRVGVLVDLEEKEGRQGGSIRFFVNGEQFGPGFESGVTGPLVPGVRMWTAGQKVTLLPDAQRPAGF